jgi:energy-converting hydrogenase B subunit D
MTSFWVLDYLILAVILTSAVLVARLRNLNGAVMALSAMGTMMALLFVVLGAPDVAHSEVVVGSIALPVLYLVAIGKARAQVPDQSDLNEPANPDKPDKPNETRAQDRDPDG